MKKEYELLKKVLAPVSRYVATRFNRPSVVSTVSYTDADDLAAKIERVVRDAEAKRVELCAGLVAA